MNFKNYLEKIYVKTASPIKLGWYRLRAIVNTPVIKFADHLALSPERKQQILKESSLRPQIVRMQRAGYRISRVTINGVSIYGKPPTFLLQAQLSYRTPDGVKDGYNVIFMPDAAALLVAFRVVDYEISSPKPSMLDDHYVVMVQQPRIAAGRAWSLQVPAGILDKATGKFSLSEMEKPHIGALREYAEEANAGNFPPIDPEDLRELGTPVSLHPAITDRQYQYHVIKDVTREKLEEIKRRVQGSSGTDPDEITRPSIMSLREALDHTTHSGDSPFSTHMLARLALKLGYDFTEPLMPPQQAQAPALRESSHQAPAELPQIEFADHFKLSEADKDQILNWPTLQQHIQRMQQAGFRISRIVMNGASSYGNPLKRHLQTRLFYKTPGGKDDSYHLSFIPDAASLLKVYRLAGEEIGVAKHNILDRCYVSLIEQARIVTVHRRSLQVAGGDLEPGEDPHACAHREHREETGDNIDPPPEDVTTSYALGEPVTLHPAISGAVHEFCNVRDVVQAELDEIVRQQNCRFGTDADEVTRPCLLPLREALHRTIESGNSPFSCHMLMRFVRKIGCGL